MHDLGGDAKNAFLLKNEKEKKIVKNVSVCIFLSVFKITITENFIRKTNTVITYMLTNCAVLKLFMCLSFHINLKYFKR